MKYCLLLISFVLLTFHGNAQLSGIKSEEDLLRMGVPKSEIEKAKRQLAAQGSSRRGQSMESSGEIMEVATTKVDSLNVDDITPKPKEKDKPDNKPDNQSAHYGHDLFSGNKFQVVTNSSSFDAPDDYILGAGDKLSVVIWGNSEMSAEYTLDLEGSIYPKLVGKINLKGKSYGMAKKIVYSKFSRVYDLGSSEISINLIHSKVVSINLVGEVNNPGTYRLPSVNSVFGIISYAGGVNSKANIREIKQIRDGKVIAVYDTYHFIHGNESVPSISLKEGDFIMVSKSPLVVKTKGGFKKEGYFEIKEGESVMDLLLYSGGLNDNVSKSKLVIRRIDGTGERLINIDIDKETTLESVILQRGDEVSFYSNTDTMRNLVTVEGQVMFPGDYEWIEGENLTEFLKRAGGTTFNSSDVCFVYKMNEVLEYEVSSYSLNDSSVISSIKLDEFDKIQVLSKTDFIDQKSITMVGAVRKPGKIVFHEGITLKDAIYLSEGMKMEVFSEEIIIERLTFSSTIDNHYTRSIKVNYNENPDFLLEPFDIVVVRRLAEFSFHRQVKIYGEVMFPGDYTITDNSFKMMDLIEKAGGLTGYADIDGAVFERQKDSLGFLLMDLEEAMKDSSSNYNYAIEENDSIYIPRLVNLVSVKGAIGYKQVGSNSTVNVAFKKGKRAKYYIKNYAAGFDKKARRFGIYSVRRDGLIQKSKLFGLIRPKVFNGDKIIVLYKASEEKENIEKKAVDWNRQIENITVKITGLLTVYALVRTIQ